jgi:hypothetical protein
MFWIASLFIKVAMVIYSFCVCDTGVELRPLYLQDRTLALKPLCQPFLCWLFFEIGFCFMSRVGPNGDPPICASP